MACGSVRRNCGFFSVRLCIRRANPPRKFLVSIIAETISLTTSSTTKQPRIKIAQSSQHLKMDPFPSYLKWLLSSPIFVQLLIPTTTSPHKTTRSFRSLIVSFILSQFFCFITTNLIVDRPAAEPHYDIVVHSNAITTRVKDAAAAKSAAYLTNSVAASGEKLHQATQPERMMGVCVLGSLAGLII